MTFTMQVRMDNAAFEDAPGLELARILEGVARRIEESGRGFGRVLDLLGNDVGWFKVHDGPR